MLKVKDVLESLSLGVFSNLSIGNEGDGTIKATSISNVVLHLNEALTSLYGRFTLSEKILYLLTFGNRVEYSLVAENSFSSKGLEYDPNSINPSGPYIIDELDDPFYNDIIKIMSVYNSYGTHLPLNDLEASNSIFSPHNRIIQVPNPLHGDILTLEYHANHKKIVYDANNISSLDQVVDLPEVLYEALYSYIAYKVYGNMNTKETVFRSRDHKKAYEEECIRVVERDLVMESRSFTNSKFDNRGWV